jgi:AcrR family transcriptional regulator
VRTGRPRAFCVDETLDRAMTVFWRQGYEGASMAALTKAMGINAPSLYACFGNKEGLFKAVVDRYEARRENFMKEITAKPTAYAVAEAFLSGVAGFCADTGGKNPPGCLMLQGALSCCEQEISDDMARRRADKEAALKKRFEQAKKTGDLPKSSNPAVLARYLATMANGLAVHAAAGATAQELREVAAVALAAWPAGSAAVEKPRRAKVSA